MFVCDLRTAREKIPNKKEVRKITIAQSLLTHPEMRHGPFREMYRRAVRVENERRKYWKAQRLLKQEAGE